MRSALKTVIAAAALSTAGLSTFAVTNSASAEENVCSVWIVEASRFMNVPYGSFVPDRAYVPDSTSPMHNINTVDLPVNVGVIKCGNELILADSGWKQEEYFKMTGTEHHTPIAEELKLLGFDAKDVTK